MSIPFAFPLAQVSRRACLLFAMFSMVLLMGPLSSTVLAGPEKGQADNASPPVQPELPPAEDVELVTSDKVLLKATFYPGTNGKDTVPVVLLHTYQGNRKDYASLALYLQKQGHAVLTPDLRGHGDSTQVQDTNQRLDAKAMPAAAFAPMVAADMEACKKFLIEKNNAGRLNIEKLCLIGAEMGSVVAMDYARLDWSWPPLVNVKQGQDVKALVLISPQWSFRTLRAKPFLDQPKIASQISTMIVVGKRGARPRREAQRLNTMLSRLHPNTDVDKPADLTLIFSALPTSLQGTKMLDASELQVAERIKWFIEWRLVKQTFPWKKRDPMPTIP